MNAMTQMESQTAGDKAAGYFTNGFHCAEAVATAVLEVMGHNPSEAAAHATAFGGGFGRTFQEACGALSGGLIAIGHLHGRRAPVGEWDLPARLGEEIRRRFLENYGTTHCLTLRERFGKEHQTDECQKLVKVVAASLTCLLHAADDFKKTEEIHHAK